MKKKELNCVTKLLVDAFIKEKKTKRWSVNAANKYINIIYRISKDVCFVAVEGNEIIGISLNEIWPEHEREILKLSMLVVNEKYRNKKVASKLIKKTITKANKKYDVEDVELGVETITNFPVMWFEKIGFNKKENYEILKGKILEIITSF